MLKYLSIIATSIVILSFAGITKAESIYWIEDRNKIRRVNLDGSNVTDLIASDQSALIDVEVTDSFIYWVDWVKGRNKIRRVNLDGSNVTDLITSDARNTISIEVTDSFIYWVEKGKKIKRADLDGSNVVSIAELPRHEEFDIDRSFIYFASRRNRNLKPGTGLFRADLDGKNLTELIFIPDRLLGHHNMSAGGLNLPVPDFYQYSMKVIEVTDSFIYWFTNYGGTSIKRSNLDGSNTITVIENHPLAFTTFTIINSYIFWLDGGGRIYRANLDGTNVKTILKKGLKDTRFLATDAVNSVNSDNPEGVQFGGNTHDELKDYQRAIADYTQAISRNPDSAPAYYNRGTTYYYLKDYQRAIADFNKAIELQPDYVSAYINRGFAYYETQAQEGAIEQWQKALSINPKKAEAKLALAVALYSKGEQEKALSSAEAVLKSHSQWTDVEYLKQQFWGDALIADTQKLFGDSRFQAILK